MKKETRGKERATDENERKQTTKGELSTHRHQTNTGSKATSHAAHQKQVVTHAEKEVTGQG